MLHLFFVEGTGQQNEQLEVVLASLAVAEHSFKLAERLVSSALSAIEAAPDSIDAARWRAISDLATRTIDLAQRSGELASRARTTLHLGDPAGATEIISGPDVLCARIIAPPFLPAVPIPEGQTPIVARIIKDNVLQVGGEQIKLKSTNMAAFNATMLLRAHDFRINDAVRLGFGTGLHDNPNRRTIFFHAFCRIAVKLHKATGEEIFQKKSPGTQIYLSVDPRFTLEDQRT